MPRPQTDRVLGTRIGRTDRQRENFYIVIFVIWHYPPLTSGGEPSGMGRIFQFDHTVALVIVHVWHVIKVRGRDKCVIERVLIEQ